MQAWLSCNTGASMAQLQQGRKRGSVAHMQAWLSCNYGACMAQLHTTSASMDQLQSHTTRTDMAQLRTSASMDQLQSHTTRTDMAQLHTTSASMDQLQSHTMRTDMAQLRTTSASMDQLQSHTTCTDMAQMRTTSASMDQLQSHTTRTDMAQSRTTCTNMTQLHTTHARMAQLKYKRSLVFPAQFVHAAYEAMHHLRHEHGSVYLVRQQQKQAQVCYNCESGGRSRTAGSLPTTRNMADLGLVWARQHAPHVNVCPCS
eukprot:1150768-Pelagomonas_calceolata.AAC.3